MNYNYDKPSVLSVNVFYLMAGLMLLFIGFYVQSKELYLGLLVTEYVLILIPNIIFIKIKGLSLKRVLRLNRFSFKQFIYTILIVLFSYPIAVFLNLIVLNIINVFTDFIPTSVPMPVTPQELFISFLIIGVTPGICEEVMFRGTMISGYESTGYRKSIIITSLLFGIFHFNITNLVGPTFLGIILAVIAIKSNSIYLPIIGHTLNNTIALLIGYIATKYSPELDNIDSDFGISIVPDTMAVIITTITIGLVALLCGLILYRLIKKFPSTYTKKEIGIVASSKNSKLTYLPVYLIIVLFILLSWFTLKYA